MQNESLSPAQCRAARALIDLSQEQLAGAASVARKTLADFEGGRSSPQPRTVAAIRTALESAGVVFVEENGHGPGVRLRKAVKE